MLERLTFDVQGAVSALPIAVFAAILIAEIAAPRRSLCRNPLARWIGNTGLYLVNVAAVAVLAPAGAELMERLGLRLDILGAAHAPSTWFVASQVAGVILLDLLLYLLHRLYHLVPFLWRFHAVHHADTVVDVTTAVRHHPGEFLINYAILSVIAAGIGLWPVAVGAYGVVVLTLQMAQHANIRFPEGLDRVLRRMLVTPDMHRIHHAVALAEGNSNFGTALSLWDRLAGTYLEPTAQRNANAEFGVGGLHDARYQQLHWMLLTPAKIRTVPQASQPRPSMTAMHSDSFNPPHL
jgi:sterol desaturase/sphingolipid hydroxylase (fatty acid hydroxylase superfamily)